VPASDRPGVIRGIARGLRPGFRATHRATAAPCLAPSGFNPSRLRTWPARRCALRLPSGLPACAAACWPPCRPCASWVCSSPSGWPLSALIAYPPLGLCRQGAFAAYAHSLRSLRYSTVPMTAAQLRVVGAYRDQPKADEQIHRGDSRSRAKRGCTRFAGALYVYLPLPPRHLSSEKRAASSQLFVKDCFTNS
jgi:hypothetical protein